MALETRNWSDDDLNRLAEMRGAGQTYSQIAAEFSVTRHAIAGVLFRRLREVTAPLRHVVRKVRPAKVPKAEETGSQASAQKGGALPAEIPAEPVPKIPLKGSKRNAMFSDFGAWEEREAVAINRRLFGPGEPLPLIHLGRCQCRYAVAEDSKVLGGWLFCAKPTEPEQSYCALHQEAIQAPRRSA